MAKSRKRSIGLLSAMVLCASFVGLAAPVGAQAQQEPAIRFINPSDFSEDGNIPVISSQDTGGAGERPEATTYRLNAWTKGTPIGAVVEFEIDTALGTINIGTAARLADDVFEFDWDVDSDIAVDGRYRLRAMLFSGTGAGAQELARHELDVLVQDNQSERSTADITYPTNAGPAGFYTNPKTGGTNIMVDYAISSIPPAPSTSDQTYIYYTVSPPGEEPAWKQCDLEASAPAVCNLESIDQGGGSVTAIAAASNEDASDNNESFNAGGDAVRVFPYGQDATNILVEPTTRLVSSDEGTFPCSGDFVGFVIDQLGRPISDIPVDVHAQGPTDQLRFTRFDDASEPDEGGHPVEPAYECVSGTPSPIASQGEHNRPGAPDVKHEEETDNADSPTDDDQFGVFTVALHSPDAGGTQITFWADEDDDDFYCSQEPAVAASVGWDQEAPAPTVEQPEKTNCPIPEPPDPDQVPECSDGVDNDGDGETDHPEDDGCSSPEDDDETDEGEDPRGCTVTGTDDGESIEGTEDDDVICGNGGDDIINGMGGNDVIYGDGGDDEIRGGLGDDTIHGGDGRDTIRGGSGNDDATGDAGDDAILGGSGTDSLKGNQGGDTIRGGTDGDDLRGGGGDDVLTGGGGGDTIRGGGGPDTLKGGKGPDVIRGGRDDDNLRGSRGHDTLNGGSGTDTCRGGRGRDRTVNCER